MRTETLTKRPKRPVYTAKDITMSGFHELTQLAIITPDANQTMATLHDTLRWGAFKVIEASSPALFNTTYGGKEEEWSMRIGVTWVGDMQVEVIQPLKGATVFADYLAQRGGRAGIQHIYWERASESYEGAISRFQEAGYKWQQEAQLNAKGRLGVIPVPALPKALAGRYASRFGYTNTQDELKVDIELAKFPPGVSQRLALRAAIAEEWIPKEHKGCFETPLPTAMIGDIDAISILTHDLDALIQAYSVLTEHPIQRERGGSGVGALPGVGQVATIQFATCTLFLIQPDGGPLEQLLLAEGEGPTLLRGRPTKDVQTTAQALSSLGWQVLSSSEPTHSCLATHQALPFALWVVPL